MAGFRVEQLAARQACGLCSLAICQNSCYAYGGFSENTVSACRDSCQPHGPASMTQIRAPQQVRLMRVRPALMGMITAMVAVTLPHGECQNLTTQNGAA